MGFGSDDKKVYDLLNDKMFIVAANQRKYVWNQNNWREMLEDIDLVFENKTDKHFIGSVVLKKETINDGIKNHFSIIDGQQRITTLTIMLCAMAFIFAEHEEKADYEGLEKHLFVTDNKKNAFPIVSINANKYISKLVEVLYEEVNSHFISHFPLLSATDLLKKAGCIKVIKDCFLFFYSELKKRTETDLIALSNYLDIVLEIRYIDITAEEDEDAYTIFEVLNARGQALTDFELLRNYLFRYSNTEEKDNVKKSLSDLEELLQDEIEIFLKHYALHKYGAKTDKNENRPYKAITKQVKGNVTSFLQDLLLKASYYKKMIAFKDCSSLEYKIFSFFKPRRQQQFRPIVMGLMHQRDLGNLSDNDYEKYLEYLYEFFICYHIIGEKTSNKIEDIVYGYSYKIESGFTIELLNKFQIAMAERIPSKSDFINSIKRIRYSNQHKAYSGSRKREDVIAILELLERELGYDGSFDDITVEHCYPDAQDIQNAHIGNLILLEKDINENKCKGKPLPQKVSFYSTSKLEYPKIISAKFNSNDGVRDFDKNSQWVADKLFDRIKNVMLLSV
ncbi:MAG: DUF262 domain-containing protein [Clostridia bacterium]|nr:DUF262 domain-containing protein [Clostridia bacterium]